MESGYKPIKPNTLGIDNAFPLIAPLIRLLESQGAIVTDKAIHALNFAALDAKQNEYIAIYDDNLLTGVIKSQGSITHLLTQMGIDLEQVIDDAHKQLFTDNKHFIKHKIDYRRRYDSKRSRKAMPRRDRRPFRSFGFLDRYYARADIGALPAYVAEMYGEVGSEDLFLAALRMPAAWLSLNQWGISVNKIRRHAKVIRQIEPDIEKLKYIMSFNGSRYGFDAFELLEAGIVPSHEDDIEKGTGICRANILTPRRIALGHEIEEFEWLINKPNVVEYDILRFLESHPGFLLGIEYKALHSQITLVGEDLLELRPDFFIERIDLPFSDIVELKLPTAPLVVGSPNRRTFSAAVISAMGQLKEYRKYFLDSSNRSAFRQKHGFMVYLPRIFVVIGRSHHFQTPYERIELEEELKYLRLLTYDDLMDRAKRRMDLILEGE